MSIFATFVCDYPECEAISEPVETHEIDRYDWHDAPMEGLMVTEPSGWLRDILYNWIACPAHFTEMLTNRKQYERHG